MLKDTGLFGIISTIRRTGDEGLKDITDIGKRQAIYENGVRTGAKRNGIYST